MIPTTYMYFPYNKKKCCLFNSDEYKIDISNNTSISIPPWEERLLLCYINYSSDIEKSKIVINQFLNGYYKDFPFHYRDEFIDKFINDHPQVDSNHLENPLYAINGKYSFRATSMGETITISDQEEKELVDIVNTYKEKSKRKVSQWFLKYYYQKGVNPFSMTEKVKEIAVSFIAERGYVVNRGVNVDGILTGVATVWKILIFIVAVPIFIWLVFSVFKVVFS